MATSRGPGFSLAPRPSSNFGRLTWPWYAPAPRFHPLGFGFPHTHPKDFPLVRFPGRPLRNQHPTRHNVKSCPVTGKYLVDVAGYKTGQPFSVVSEVVDQTIISARAPASIPEVGSSRTGPGIARSTTLRTSPFGLPAREILTC